MRTWPWFLGGLVLLLTAAPSAPAPQGPRFDVVVLGARIADGSGSPIRRADVGIKDGRIAATGTFSAADAREAIDAKGLVVAPGFTVATIVQFGATRL